jgi:hypothetical protein
MFKDPIDHYIFPEAAAKRDEFIERVTRNTRVAKYCRGLYGPPEYLFIGRLCKIYKRYARREPAIGPGPFFRFVNAAIKQFGQGAEPVTLATLRNADDSATWPV